MLQLIDVKKIYSTKAGNVAALDGVSLTFPETGMVFVIGKSGSGKTTLLNVIGGLDGIDSGEILVCGKKFSEFTDTEYDSYRNTLVGFIFQEYNLLPDYNIEKNVSIANELQGRNTETKDVESILNSVGIENFEGRKPGEYSGGQKQRVAIARALIKNPKIIMADEPTGALDSNTGIQVLNELKNLSKEKLVIVISHDLELANKYADRIIRLVDGKVVEDYTYSEKEIETNVFDDGEKLLIKSGSDLTAVETEVIKKAVKEKKSIKVVENAKVKVKETTNESKIKLPNESVNFIKSKMKFKSAATLGVKSLGVKPLRLAFTIFLSAIAFAVFGVFDTIASYSRANVISDFLANGGYNTVAVSGVQNTKSGETYNVKFSDESISKLNSQTGYDFRPVCNMEDFLAVTQSQPSSTKTYQVRSKTSTSNLPQLSKGKGYYKTNVNGVIEFTSNEIDELGNINDYGFYLIPGGRYPQLNTQNPRIYEVAISTYLADSIIHHLNGSSTLGKVINNYEDLYGVEIKITGFTFANEVECLTIVGIYNCGEIPKKFNRLKDSYVGTKSEEKYLSDELDAFLNAGAHRLMFVAEGAIKDSQARIGRKTQYYSEASFDTLKSHRTWYQLASHFYETSEFNNDVVYMFNKQATDTGYELKDDEALIHIKNVDKIFDYELAKGAYGASKLTLQDELEAKLWRSRPNNKEDGITYIQECFALADQILDRTPTENEQRIKEVTIRRKLNVNDEKTDRTIKIVGVYFGSDSYDKYEFYPLVVNKNTLTNFGFANDQGQYAYAISKTQKGLFAGNKLANLVTSKDGFALNLFGNSILTTLSKSETQISQFTTLFLYAALVLAFFSIFMLFNYISTSIVSKRHSIGILRALGSNSVDVFKMFITESIIISLISVVFAMAFSYLACILVNFYLKEIMHLIVNFAIFGIRQIIVIFVIGILTGVVASLMPIIKIAKEKPVDLIRRP